MALTDIDGQRLGDSVAEKLGNRNKIINGAMTIDQRNAGAEITPTDGTYSADRYRCGASAASKFKVQQVSEAPTGFSNSLKVTSLSAYTLGVNDNFEIMQFIEGFNTADLEYGTANAKTTTLSFYVRSSLTGTHGGSFINSAFNRSYPFSYTISTADTWEYKTITVAGDTSGTWIGSTNGIGLGVVFGLGAGTGRSGTAGTWVGAENYNATGAVSIVGTNAATFYITGVQLEAGNTATPFEHRSYGDELQRCLRYTYVLGSHNPTDNFERFGMGLSNTTTSTKILIKHPVLMRAAPTVSTPDATQFQVSDTQTGFDATAIARSNSTNGPSLTSIDVSHAGNTIVRGAYIFERNDSTSGRITFSAEL